MKVLVVDDEKVVRHICQLSLERAGYEVMEAEDGISALEILRENPSTEIVLSDLKMPVLNGIELLKDVKRDFPHVEVIIMTGFATIESAIQAMKLGAYDFLLKPLNSEQIRLAVDKCHEKITLSTENLTLKKANEKLRDIQRMKNKFIGIISHELRTPVSHLKGYSSILFENDFYGISEEERQDCIRVVNSAINDLEQIVTDMVDLINFENHNWQLHREPLNLSELIDQVVAEFRPSAADRRQDLIWKQGERPCPILADRMKIKIVLAELLQNAIKYTPDKGKIEVSFGQDHRYWIVSVKDSGVGIAAEEVGKIFEKFYEVQDTDNHSSSKTGFMGGGLGVGLAIARAVAEAHGGGIKVESEPGCGATFHLILPHEFEEMAASDEVARAHSRSRNTS